MTEITDAMTTVPVNGAPVLPKRGGPKPLLPGSWITRSVRAEYRDGDGRAQTMSGKLLDIYPTGLVLGSSGARVLLAWDAVVVIELVGD
jgi:hypothetical protein